MNNDAVIREMPSSHSTVYLDANDLSEEEFLDQIKGWLAGSNAEDTDAPGEQAVTELPENEPEQV